MIGSARVGLAAVVAAALAPGWCWADAVYRVDLQEVNGSGVSGRAVLTLSGDELTVEIHATGLTPGVVHAQHIHGRFDASGNPIDSIVPPPDLDADGDGFVEVAEGLAGGYGPVILPLLDATGSFPTAASDGTLEFQQTYLLSDPSVFGGSFERADLFPLTLRAMVLHGGIVPDGPGLGTGGEVNGVGGYKGPLPVAVGEIVVPLPATVWPGLVLLGGLAMKRRRAAGG